MNLSGKSFTITEYKLLGYGLNFIPAKPIFNKTDVIKDIDAFSRKIKLRAHFDADTPERSDLQKKFHLTNKSWEPSNVHHTVSTFLEKFRNDTIAELNKAKPNPARNLSAMEQNALDCLKDRSDIIISKADKGGATVIMDVKDYIDEANRQLNDSNFYRKLDEDPTETHLNLVNNAIDTLQRQKHIDQKLAEGLKLSSAKTPKFYMLPKIHKEGNPGRPVVSSIECHTSKISEYVDHILQPIVEETPSYVKDTTDFIKKLNACGNEIDGNTYLVTLDVKSLYTKIPNDEGIRANRTFLARAGKAVLIPVVTKFLWLILTLNNFIFNGMNYLQTNGASMGTKCAPNYANLFMAHFEEMFIYPRIRGKALLYLRYIDDIFLIWKGTKEELVNFITEINTVHESIKFDVNYSTSNVNFLDTTVTINPDHSIKTSLYQKPTDRHNFLHQKSYHPSSTKKSLPYSQALRIRRICSSPDDERTALEKLKEQFAARGYKYAEVQQAIDRAKTKNREDLLSPAAKEKRNIPLTLVTTFNKSLPNMKNVLAENWALLSINRELSKKFRTEPLIAYRRNPNLRQLLGGNKIENGQVVKRTQNKLGKCSPCKINLAYKCCRQIKKTSTFKNRFSGKEFKIFHNVNCKDRNVLYLLECLKCNGKAYVGKTETPMNLRMNGHRSDSNNRRKLAVDIHFGQPGHNFERDARFTIIEKIKKSNLQNEELTNLLLRREDFWMVKLQTIEPNGFNQGLNFAE